jgi:glycosyltransferase involved in cell wall biosynthesis
VLIDARLPDERSGGVQQWVIGLASGLAKLNGTDEYRFLMNEGQEGWLAPYLTGPCRVYVERPSAPAAANADAISAAVPAARKPLGPVQGIRRALGTRFPILRRIKRRFRPPKPAPHLTPFDRIAARAHADVVHFPVQTAAPTSVPSIYQPWDLQHLHLPEFFTDAQLAGRGRRYVAYSAQAALVVVATKWVQQDVSTQFHIPLDRIAVVNPGPATDVYVPPTATDEARFTEQLGLQDRYVFYPAQPWGHKNHERLFEALRLLRDRGIVVPLVCSGYHNDGYPRVVASARDHGLEAQVRFLGFVGSTEIQVLYRRATALIFPSLYEGWGLPILEAFSAGLPVACSNVTSLPELVGDAALVFDPLDASAIAAAVERLWTDDQLRVTLIERGRARGAQFDWDRTARLMRAYYRSVASRRLSPEDRALIEADPLV